MIDDRNAYHVLHDTPLLQHAGARNAVTTAPLHPFAQQKCKLGPKAYKRALKAARLIEAGP